MAIVISVTVIIVIVRRCYCHDRTLCRRRESYVGPYGTRPNTAGRPGTHTAPVPGTNTDECVCTNNLLVSLVYVIT